MTEATNSTEPVLKNDNSFVRQLLLVSAVCLTGIQLRWQGRRWWCECGQWNPWSSDAWGSHNSQHFLDPYSLSHLLHGVLLCGVGALMLSRISLQWRFVLSVVVECLWELVENSAFVIARYRAATASLGYEGDSITNSMGDIVSCALGFWLASRLGLWKSVAIFIAIELLMLVWIRDSLAVNVIMLIHPVEFIRAWQMQGV